MYFDPFNPFNFSAPPPSWSPVCVDLFFFFLSFLLISLYRILVRVHHAKKEHVAPLIIKMDIVSMEALEEAVTQKVLATK